MLRNPFRIPNTPHTVTLLDELDVFQPSADMTVRLGWV